MKVIYNNLRNMQNDGDEEGSRDQLVGHNKHPLQRT